jgi:tRNA A37 N6-isopentenylltransferase MiaA
MKRILIIGTSGCGKSTLARRLAECLSLPYFPSDPFYWEDNWKPASSKRVQQQLIQVVEMEAWVLDGNFDDHREIVWRYADCLIWLDYSFLTIVRRVIARNLHWALTRQSTWSGNRMTFQRFFSGVGHTIRSYPAKRRNYPRHIAELSGVVAYRFRESHQTESWLTKLSGTSKTESGSTVSTHVELPSTAAHGGPLEFLNQRSK